MMLTVNQYCSSLYKNYHKIKNVDVFQDFWKKIVINVMMQK